jgi:DNA-binding transcriptional LysR family regulator
VALTDVAELPFVALRRTSQLRPLADRLCAAAGFTPQVAFECDDLPTLRAFVGAGLGVAVVPATVGAVRDPDTGPVRHVPLTDAGAVREVGLAWSAERRLLPSAELFRQHVLQRAAAGGLPALVDGG